MPSAHNSGRLLRTKLYRPPLPGDYLERTRLTAVRINNRNASMPWESARCISFVASFLERQREEADDHEDRGHEVGRLIGRDEAEGERDDHGRADDDGFTPAERDPGENDD